MLCGPVFQEAKDLFVIETVVGTLWSGKEVGCIMS